MLPGIVRLCGYVVVDAIVSDEELVVHGDPRLHGHFQAAVGARELLIGLAVNLVHVHVLSALRTPVARALAHCTASASLLSLSALDSVLCLVKNDCFASHMYSYDAMTLAYS